MITTHFCGSTTACLGIAFTRTIRLSSLIVLFIPPASRKSEQGPPCCSMPLGACLGILLCVVWLKPRRKCVKQRGSHKGARLP